MTKSMYLGILAGIIIVGGLLWWVMGSRTNTGSEASTDFYSTSTDSMNTTTNGTGSDATSVTGTVNVTLKTTKGDIVIALDGAHAPIAAANFVKLAQSGFYDGVKFHRVIKGFMNQAGDPLTKDDSKKAEWGTGGPGYTIEDEFQNGLKNERGTIAMANTGAPHSSGSQFFINAVDNAFLNGGYTVFGKVTSGMDVVDAINNTPTGGNDVPTTPITITKVEVSQ